jgi:hypothetical protein
LTPFSRQIGKFNVVDNLSKTIEHGAMMASTGDQEIQKEIERIA